MAEWLQDGIGGCPEYWLHPILRWQPAFGDESATAERRRQRGDECLRFQVFDGSNQHEPFLVTLIEGDTVPTAPLFHHGFISNDSKRLLNQLGFRSAILQIGSV